MKKIFLVFFSLILTVSLYLISTKTATAQGTCSCSVSAVGICGIFADNCDAAGGYAYQCTTTLSQCSPGYSSCTCILIDPTADPNCGGVSQSCCAGNQCDNSSLYCDPTAAGDYCVGIAQLCCQPGGAPPGTDCSGIVCYPVGTQKIFCSPSSGTLSTDPQAGGIYTAIGCIPMTTTGGFVSYLLRWGMGIAGGIAFIMIIYSGYLVISSGGNPQKLQAGKELLTAAISGLLLLVFGAFVLEFIGVDILNIPGFGR